MIMSAHLSNAPSADEFLTDLDPETKLRAEHDSGIFRLADLESDAARERRLDAELYARFSPMVRRISLKAVRSLPRSIAVDDIISAGWVGMSEAINRRPTEMPDEQFDAYASYRIRGAILDYLRALDPLSRRLRSLAREIQLVTRELSHSLGRHPEQDEIAKRIGIGLPELQRTMADIQESGVDRLDGTTGMDTPSGGPSPEFVASQNQMMRAVAEFSKELPERLQIVINLHYQHECSLREIGEILGVTESRVCQLHAEAIQKIRARVDGRIVAPSKRRRVH
jgi:RNA polymerase sigma factor for flagellar operon FliA